MAQKTRSALKSLFETGDKPTQQDFADLIDSSPNIQEEGELVSVEKDPFTETIDITTLLSHSPAYTQSAELNIVKGLAGTIGGTYQVLITTNGDAINFSTDFYVFDNDYEGLTQGQYLFIFAALPNGKIGVTISDTGEDLINPTISSATVEDAAKSSLVVALSEPVNITDTTGLSLNFTTGTAKTLTGTVTGTGTNTLTFTLSADIENGDVFTLEVASNNTITDLAGNALLSTSVNVTNNVAAPGPIVFYDTFDGTTPDTSKWNWAPNNSPDIEVTQNDKAIWTDQTTNSSASTESIDTENKFTIDTTQNDYYVKADLDASNLSTGKYRLFNIKIDNDNKFYLMRQSSTNDETVLHVKIDGVEGDYLSTGVQFTGPFKLAIKNSTVYVYHWDGSSWGSSLVSDSIKDGIYHLSFSRAVSSDTGEVWTVDNVYVSTEDFTTLNP